MLVVNDDQFIKRAEIIWEKGTNRSAFFKGEVDKYGWVDVGSSFLPSDITAAFLWAQLEHLDEIQDKRKVIWNTYYEGLRDWCKEKDILLPLMPENSTNNAHMFYLVCKNESQRNDLILYLKENNINAVFHYLSLHKSPYYIDKSNGSELIQSDLLSNTLVRLPFYISIDVNEVLSALNKFH